MSAVGRLTSVARRLCSTDALLLGNGMRSSMASKRIVVSGQFRQASNMQSPGPAAKSRGPPGLIGPSGLPLPSAGADPNQGPEIELNAQNAAQVLQSPAPVLLQVGSPGEAVTKKLGKLRAAAKGKLPVVKLDCRKFPQICQALQIRSEPVVFLMAQGQVANALEDDFSPQVVTGFVEKCGQMLGLQVSLAEGASEQLAEAEQMEWQDAAMADGMFKNVGSAADLPQASRVRASAGVARCALWMGRADEATAIIDQLTGSGHDKAPEVKQAVALSKLHSRNVSESGSQLDELKAAVEASPTDVAVVEAYIVPLFWSGKEAEAVDAGLALLRRKRSDEARKLVLTLIEALGPRHPRYTKARKSFSSALFA